jgi:hypothetical protein
MDNIESAKLRFLKMYNPNKSNKTALEKAIGAAVSRNKLYSPFVTNTMKLRVNCFWKDRLAEIGKKYIKNQYSEKEYLESIVGLKSEMNKKFHKLFTSKTDVKDEVDPGYRISHAQKSISVYLKHLWCINNIKTSPTQCPIDRNILTLIINKGKIPAWTKVNSLKSHNDLIQLIKNQALIDKYDSVAEWELVHYFKK